MVTCTAIVHMIGDMIIRLCDWKHYETVKNRDSVNSIQTSPYDSSTKNRESVTSAHTIISLANVNEHTSLTLRISNRNSGLVMMTPS